MRQAACETLRKLDPAVLASYAPVVITKLNDGESGERQLTCEKLVQLDPEVLATHVPAAIAKLDEGGSGVRKQCAACSVS